MVNYNNYMLHVYEDMYTVIEKGPKYLREIYPSSYNCTELKYSYNRFFIYILFSYWAHKIVNV